MAAKVILGMTKSESSKDCLIALHWLPVRERIEFKILALVFKCIIWGSSCISYGHDTGKRHASGRP